MSDHRPVTHHDLQALKESTMSALSDAVAQLNARLDAAEARVNAKIAALEANASTPADLEAVTTATAKVDAIAADATTTTTEHPAS